MTIYDKTNDNWHIMSDSFENETPCSYQQIISKQSRPQLRCGTRLERERALHPIE
jgi:hypothetical protein